VNVDGFFNFEFELGPLGSVLWQEIAVGLSNLQLGRVIFRWVVYELKPIFRIMGSAYSNMCVVGCWALPRKHYAMEVK